MVKIAIAEDDQFIRRALVAKLTRVGYEVRAAVDGEELLNILKAFTPNLVILDLVMPKKDGFETLKEIKADPKLKNIPVLVASNLSQEGDVEQTLKLGASDFLLKSEYTIEALVQKIQKLIK